MNRSGGARGTSGATAAEGPTVTRFARLAALTQGDPAPRLAAPAREDGAPRLAAPARDDGASRLTLRAAALDELVADDHDVIEAPRRPALRLLKTRPLRVVDVAMWYGERSGGIRTYLDAKAAFARRTGAFEHRLVVPGIVRKVTEHTCSLPSIRVANSNGYRWPIGTRPLVDLLRELEPDVVMLHDPFWAPKAVQSIGVPVVMVHHGSIELDAHAFPGPTKLYRPLLRRWMRHAYAGADAVMSACDPRPDTGRDATLPLRFGLDSAFYPEGDEQRGEHVLYAGRIGREKGVFGLLEAAALSAEPWPLWLMGTGSAANIVDAQIARLGLADRVRLVGFVRDRDALASAYRSARCVVMPGEFETFGLVAYEAAASGAATVACTTAPSVRALGDLVHTFEPGDPHSLLAAIERARASDPDRLAAARFAAANRWERAFAAELADLEHLVAQRRAV
jgi:alpha-1,6-mannosyltransferase